MEERLLIRYEEEVEPIRLARQGSEGSLIVKKLMDPEDTGSTAGIVLVGTFFPDHIPITAHSHQGYEESAYVVTGHGRIKLNLEGGRTKTYELRPGACVCIPSGCDHVVEVEGNEPLKMVFSYFSARKKGKSHHEIATNLTDVPFRGKYGE